MSGSRDSISQLCASTVKALGHGVADWVRERHLDFEAGIRYRTPAGRLYAYLWWLGLVFVQVVLALMIVDGLTRYGKSIRELARGEKYLAEKDFATAEACFDAALRLYPYSVAPYQYEGQLMLTRYFAGHSPDVFGSDSGMYAADRFDDTSDREKLVHDGIAFLDAAIQLEGKRTLPVIIRKQGDKISEAYYWRGRGRLQLGQYEQALSDFSNTIRIRPEHAQAFHYRGCCYFALLKLDAADADFEQAVNLDPTLRETLATEMPYRENSPELERSITGLTRRIVTLQREPSQRRKLALTYAARGDAFVLKKDFGAAMTDYSRCLAVTDDTAEIDTRLSLLRKLAPSVNTHRADAAFR